MASPASDLPITEAPQTLDNQGLRTLLLEALDEFPEPIVRGPQLRPNLDRIRLAAYAARLVRARGGLGDLLQRFNSLLLSSDMAGADGSAEDQLKESFAALTVDAEAYAAEHLLVGLATQAPNGARPTEAAATAAPPPSAAQYDSHAHAAATRAQATVRGHLVRCGLAEARALYAFGASPPPNACLRRILGGPRAHTYALCVCGEPAIPFNLQNVLAISPHSFSESPGLAAAQAAAMELGNWQPADASSSSEGKKRIKGAAARKAAAKAVLRGLQTAREAALEAHTRVTEVGGELYFLCSEALEKAEAQRNVVDAGGFGVPGRHGVLDVRWLDPSITKAQVQEAFEAFGTIKHVQVCNGDDRAPTVTIEVKGRAFQLECNSAIITFSHASAAMAAQKSLNGKPLLRAGALEVTLAFGGACREDDDPEPDFDNVDDDYADTYEADAYDDMEDDY